MSTAIPQASLAPHRGWLLALGFAMIAIGTIALGAAAAVTLASVVFFGALLLVGGAVEGVQALRVRPWSGALLHVLSAALSIVLGFLLVTKPVEGSLSLTLLIAAFLLVGGAFRAGAAIAVDLPGRGLAILGGVVSFALGLLIWSEMPGSGLFVIGTFLGIDMIFRGWWTLALAWSLPGR
jgi:uncharacterized membrane protein HdeD (DUF308 family)